MHMGFKDGTGAECRVGSMDLELVLFYDEYDKIWNYE